MGGDLLVRGAVGLARRLQIPPVVVAATVVGFGTSLPELVVSVQATLAGSPGLILGNVVGSNIANVLLVGGASAAILPLVYRDAALRRNVVIMSAATLGFAALAAVRDVDRTMGVVLLSAFALIMVTTAGATIRDQDPDASTPLDWVLGLPSRLSTIAVFLVVGVVMLPLGAQLLVSSAVRVAAAFDVPEPVVGLTVLAIGTSLPELSTSVLAALEKRSDVAIGAIVGSNTFNLLAIMGVTASLSVAPVEVSTRFLALDVPVMLLSSALLAFFAWSGRPIGRSLGIGMLLAYGAYLTALYVTI